MFTYKTIKKIGKYAEYCISDIFLELDEDDKNISNIMKFIEKSDKDNKTMFEITTWNETKFFVYYCDNKLFFGFAIVKGYCKY